MSRNYISEVASSTNPPIRRGMALGGILTLAAIICVIIILTTGFYSVPADSVGVVQRFGKYIDTTGAGPHFKIPLGVDAVTTVPIQRQLKLEFGFGSEGATNPR